MNRKSDQAGILRRGSACLSCRRRKLRCDGTRPVCSPCSTMKRSQECKYDDSLRKSRTQTLREKKAALEARVLELEANPSKSLGTPSAAATWPRLYQDEFLDPILSNSSIYTPDSSIWNAAGYDATYLPTQDGSPFSFQFDSGGFDFATASPTSLHLNQATTSSHLDGTLSTSLPLGPPLRKFSESSGTSTQDSAFDRIPHESSPALVTSREMHDVLIESFILHRKQCNFYSNTSRFDPSSSPLDHNSPPTIALMSAIYLMGSFFAQIPGWESQLLEQTLHEVSRSLHNADPPADMVQALCLLAQYFFFTARDMEGNRHLSAAKRIAIDIGLHQVSPAATFPFGPEYTFDAGSSNWLEQSAIFWQLYMVNNCWSTGEDCCVASSTLGQLCRHISTPLPVVSGAPFESIVGNSTIHYLYEADDFYPKHLSVMALKAMGTSIFDRSLRVHNTVVKAEATWTYRRQTETALSRLSDLVQPHTVREPLFTTERASVDSDLYAVQSLIVASTINLHLDSTMDLKISRSARSIVELIHQLTDDDYPLLDPVLCVCWSSIAKVFHGMLDTAKQKIEANGPSSSLNFAVTYLDHCIQVLFSALQNISRTIPLADVLLKNLENSHSPQYPGLNKTLPIHMEEEYSLIGHNLVM